MSSLHVVAHLQNPLIFFSVCMVCLLGRCDVVLEIGGRVLPCLQALGEELCDLQHCQ
jgi:hypothetical protein